MTASRFGLRSRPRPLAFAFTMDAPYLLNVSPMFAELAQGELGDRQRAYADPEWRDKAWRSFDDATMQPRWDTYELADNASHPELDGARVDALAADRGVTPLDVLLDAALGEPDLQFRVRCIVANDDRDALTGLLLDEHCTLGLSDAGAHVGQLLRRPAGHRLSWQLGTRPGSHAAGSRGPQAHRSAGRPLRLP